MLLCSHIDPKLLQSKAIFRVFLNLIHLSFRYWVLREMCNLGMECHWNVKKMTDIGIRSWICGEYFWTPGAGKCWQFPTSSQGGRSQPDWRKFRFDEPSVRHQLEEKYFPFSSIPSVIMGCKCNCALQLGAFIKFVFQRLCYSERYLYIMQASKVSGSCM